MNIGYFGLSANPVHIGHKRVVEKALQQLDEVWVCPAYTHPFAKKMIDYKHRLEMTKRTFARVQGVKVLEIDKLFIMQTQKQPFTYHILSFCRDRFGVSPKFIIGEDNYAPEMWQKFNFHNEIEKEFGLIVINDNGVHSTQIREMVQKQQWDEVLKHCNADVVQYIKDNKLY